jgi:O-antigen/teichoic acid export membrane protein
VLLNDNEDEEFHRQLGGYIRILAAFALGSLLLFTFAGNFLLGLFGHNFAEGHMPLVVLGVGYVVVLIGGLIQPILQIREETTIVITTMLVLLGINIGLTYLLAPKYGAMGAATAYTVSVTVIYVTQLYLLQHRVGIPYLPAVWQRAAGRASEPA